MKSNYHIFYESLIRTSLVAIAARSPAHFNRILGEGKSFLLLEEFSNEEARNLATALKDQKAKTLEVANALPGAMKTIKGLLNKLAGEIDGVSNTEEIATLSIKGDTKALKKKIENLNSVFMRVGNVTASVVETMINAADNLDAGGFSDDVKTMKLSDLEETGATTGSAEYQKVKKILNAVIKSFAVPEWQTSAIEKGTSSAKSAAGSAWGAFTKFFGNLFAKAKEKIQDDAKGAFAADLRLLTIKEIIGLKGGMEAARAALQSTAQEAAAATAASTADTANPSGASGGPATAATPDPSKAAAVQQKVAAAADEQSLGKTLAALAKTITDGIPMKITGEAEVKATRDVLQKSLIDQLKAFTSQAAVSVGDTITVNFEKWLKDSAGARTTDGNPIFNKEQLVNYINTVKPGETIKKAVSDNLKVEARRRRRQSMERLTERQVVERMHTAYLRRLHEVLGETDARDSRGNVVIQPGLKVRHKKTQLEYTVDSVGEDRSGDLVIRLRNPEEPRFEPSYGQKFVGEEAPLLSARPDPMAPVGLEPLEEPEVDLEKDAGPGIEGEEEVEFVVDEKEFEKDYEVK